MTRYLLLFALMSGVLLGCREESPVNEPQGNIRPALIADFNGIGNAKSGMLLLEAVRALGGGVDTSGGSISDSNCNYAFPSALPRGTTVMVFGDTVVRFDVDTAGIRTAAGVGVGSTEAEVRSAYQGAKLQQEPHPYSGPEWHYLVVDTPSDTLHRIIFETDGRRVQRFRVGLRRAVNQIEGCS
jgi:hypothetical protein